MFKIVKKQELNDAVTRMEIEAPFIAKKAKAGQFIILRAEADGERLPLTIADYDRENGTVSIIFQIVGGFLLRIAAVFQHIFIQRQMRSFHRRILYAGCIRPRA